MIKAAGILFVTRSKHCLLLRRTGGDHSGEWCFPGGKIEDGETAEEAAVRECREEVGQCPDGDRAELCHTFRPVGITPFAGGAVAVSQDTVRFTTFIQIVDQPFEVTIDESESSAHMWCGFDELPSDMHPGADIAIRRFNGNEIEIARMIACGELPSPQQISNQWLFDLRITGTGTSYRDKHDELVYRPPENYLSADFLDRCFGLPVIINHPVALMMKEEDYVNKNVGSIRLPYIKGDEVWGVASIYDSKLAKLMQEVQLSTSPGVVFKPQNSTNQTIDVGEGQTLLIEGKAGLLDHLAICTAGVWDKGGSPLGVNAGEVDMPEAKKPDNEMKPVLDALDNILGKLGALSTRMDSLEDLERARKDAEEPNSDKWEARKDGESDDDFKSRREAWEARKDGESDEAWQARKDENPIDDGGVTTAGGGEGELKSNANNDAPAGDPDAVNKKLGEDVATARQDAAAARSENEKLRQRLAALERNQPKQLTDADVNAFGEVQARADSVMGLFSKQAPRPMHGEELPVYKRRLANLLREHSPRFKGIDMNVIKDDAAFSPIEDIVYADALEAGNSPLDVPTGMLREIRKRDITGREHVSFVGKPEVWMRDFMGPCHRITKINKEAA